jgi:hypothetical protein
MTRLAGFALDPPLASRDRTGTVHESSPRRLVVARSDLSRRAVPAKQIHDLFLLRLCFR